MDIDSLEKDIESLAVFRAVVAPFNGRLVRNIGKSSQQKIKDAYDTVNVEQKRGSCLAQLPVKGGRRGDPERVSLEELDRTVAIIKQMLSDAIALRSHQALLTRYAELRAEGQAIEDELRTKTGIANPISDAIRYELLNGKLS
jgi:hypothetical protein